MPNYAVRCECGREAAVSGVDAGGEVACECGRRVPVPSLSRLRAAAGEPAASPELVIEAELAAGTLPAERACVGCGSPDAGAWRVRVVCERPTEKADTAWYHFVFWYLLAGVVGVVLARVAQRDRPARTLGRDVRFDLPVRACEDCARAVAPRDLLRATPLYARLLSKYPHATVG